MSAANEPVLRAEFELDALGRPLMAQSGQHDHYKIRLLVDGAPIDTHAVTYELDRSYYDPIREARDRSGGFTQEVTSYGDYVVKANVRAKSGSTTLAVPLSKALEYSYVANGGLTDPVRFAIEQIRTH